MKKIGTGCLVFLTFLIMLNLTSCDALKGDAGTFAVNFSWTTDKDGNDIKPDLSTGEFYVTVRIYEWADDVDFPGDVEANGKQLTRSDPAQMKETGTKIDFGDLSYGKRRFVVAEIRKSKDLTGTVFFSGMSELFDFEAGKHTVVNVEMSMAPTPDSPEIKLFYRKEASDELTEITGSDAATPVSLIEIHVNVENADEIIIANDSSFSLAQQTFKVENLDRDDGDMAVIPEWDLNRDLFDNEETVPDGTRIVYLKLKQTNGFESPSASEKVVLDTTAPFLTVRNDAPAYNNSDIITITVSSNETLKSPPITGIYDGEGNLVADISNESEELQAGFSYRYQRAASDMPSDGEYFVKSSAMDIVDNPVSDVVSDNFSVDTTIPELVNGTIDRVKAGTGIGYTVDFEISEPVADGIPVVKANDITLSQCVQNGSDVKFRCIRTVSDEETDSTVYAVTAFLNDEAGNSSTVTIGSVMVDKTMPTVVSGTTVLSIDAGTDCALEQDQITTIAEGSVVYLSIQVSEKLEEGFTPKLIASKTNIPGLVFNLDSQNGLTYYFSYEHHQTIENLIGEYSLTISLKDEAGNTKVTGLNPDKHFIIGRNAPVLVVDQNTVSYNRSPWGRPTATELEAGGVAVYTIPADEYYELGPNDIYKAVDSLPQGTFTLSYGIESGSPVQLMAYDRDNTELRMEYSTPNEDGSWPRGNLWSYNAPGIYVSAIDSSCLETEPVMIENVNWIATMNNKIPGDNYKNPNVFMINSAVDPTLEQKSVCLQEPFSGGVKRMEQSGKGTWSLWNGDDVRPSERYDFAMVYDFARGKTVLFGGRTGSYFGETWEWDGIKWTQFNPVNSPSARYGHAMAFDSKRGKVVLFGGFPDSDYSDETWEWDGANWTRLSPGNSPSARSGHAMVYDSKRGKVVLFGGYYDDVSAEYYYSDTWEWDGSDWTEVTSGIKPSDRNSHAMVYDNVREKIVLFGGHKNSEYYQDTWEWDGTYWTKINSGNAPSGRDGHAMAYDSEREKVVLSGGYSGSNHNNDIWEWNGTDWTQINPGTLPTARSFHAMVYDRARRKTVLFGGYSYSGGIVYFNDMWEWDGYDWKQLEKAMFPSTRISHAMIYDEERETSILFGGLTDSDYSDETWKWNGTTWTQLSPANSPSARYGHAMVYDKTLKKAILFGGYGNSGYYNDTWEWDGTNWTQLSSADSPPAGHSHVMVYDSDRDKIILSGGYVGGSGYSDEIWEWDGTDWSQLNPVDSPSERTNHSMVYDPVQNEIVMFGGYAGGDAFDDIWEFNGANWIQLTPATVPDGRKNHTMVYDSFRKKAVMFGGLTDSDYNNETWEWDGTDWTQLNPEFAPSPRRYHAMVFDSSRKKTVLFGGRNSRFNAETWEWNGGSEDRPGQIMNVLWEDAGYIDDSYIKSVSVLFNAGGLGDITGTMIEGVDLLTWKHDQWVTVSSNYAGVDTLEPVTWETTDNSEIQTLLNSGLRQFNFAVVPTAPNGTLINMGKIVTDYAEVIVKYKIEDNE